MAGPNPQPFYSSDDLGTEVYDAVAELHIAGSPVEGDVEFFRLLARETGGPVLEVGCGTGRVAAALAGDGLEVVGVDLSGPMLRLAERRRATLPAEVAARLEFVEADMTDFDLGRTFALIVVPSRVFQFALAPETQRATLASMRRHLAPQGRLVLDLFDPRLDLCLPDAVPPAGLETIRHPVTGNDVRIERLSRVNDPLNQVFDEVWQTTELDAAGHGIRSVRERLSLRWTYRWEMHHLLELAGFEIVAEFGDFKGSPPAYGREQVWVVRALA
jgi:SAM-dependent methyltransferase